MGTLTPLFSLVHDFLLVSLPDEQKCSPTESVKEWMD